MIFDPNLRRPKISVSWKVHGHSHVTYKRIAQEVEVHISASFTAYVILSAIYSCWHFLLDGLYMTWGHFQLSKETAKTPIQFITSSILLLRKNIGTCVCIFSRHETKE